MFLLGQSHFGGRTTQIFRSLSSERTGLNYLQYTKRLRPKTGSKLGADSGRAKGGETTYIFQPLFGRVDGLHTVQYGVCAPGGGINIHTVVVPVGGFC